MEVVIDSDYGNFTKKPDNETHIGSVSFQFTQKVPSFSEAVVLMTGQKSILNKTIPRCDDKAMKRFKTFLVRSVGIIGKPNNDDPPPEISCPLQKVKL